MTTQKDASSSDKGSVATAQEEVDVPVEFLCPISLQIMTNPATDPASGHNFERANILEWLSRGNETNPFTRKPLRFWHLAPNWKLQEQITQWKKENGYRFEEEISEEDKKVPWYRRDPMNGDTGSSIPPPVTNSISMATGNVFIQRLIEAQRRDAEYRKRIEMPSRYSGSRYFR